LQKKVDMAHNLEIRNGQASFVENGRRGKAWHRLGTVFDRPLTIKEALTYSHANYRVALRPLVMLTPDIETEMEGGSVMGLQLSNAIVPGKKVTMRLDTHECLGIVSENYGVVQNEDAFKFIDTLVTGRMDYDEHKPVIETAGVLGRGERVFVTAKFPDEIILDNKGDDKIEMYMVFTTSHDGLGAVTCLVTPIRVVCNNTLNFAMRRNAGKLSLHHTRNIMDRLDLRERKNAEFVHRALNTYHIYKKSLEEEFKHLEEIKLAENDLMNILAEIAFEKEDLKILHMTKNYNHCDISHASINRLYKMRETVEYGVGQELGVKGSGMWLVNGVTSYFQNVQNYKTEENKFDSIQNGRAAQMMQKAYELIITKKVA
jgi:phage/plasmid-like protein (TIGR03299 family)